jgi:hypothetical protein
VKLILQLEVDFEVTVREDETKADVIGQDNDHLISESVQYDQNSRDENKERCAGSFDYAWWGLHRDAIRDGVPTDAYSDDKDDVGLTIWLDDEKDTSSLDTADDVSEIDFLFMTLTMLENGRICLLKFQQCRFRRWKWLSRITDIIRMWILAMLLWNLNKKSTSILKLRRILSTRLNKTVYKIKY